MSRVKGAARLRRTLQRIDPEVSKGVKLDMRKGAEAIQRRWVQLAPRGKSGALKQAAADPKAIGIKSNGFKVEVGIRVRRQKRIAWYFHFLEGGTKGYSGKAPKGRGATKQPYHLKVPPMRAQPSLTPAFELNRRPMRRAIERSIGRALEVAARV